MTANDPITIQALDKKHWPATWEVIKPIFRAGETFVFSPEITEKEAYKVWVDTPSETFIAVDKNNHVLGTYYIRECQPGLGSHVGNCGYIVSEHARGRGLASKLCEHSQQEAIARGFDAIQFNFVVSTNITAVRLWQKHGFDIIGTLPKAFQHARLGFVDVLVMYKQLSP